MARRRQNSEKKVGGRRSQDCLLGLIFFAAWGEKLHGFSFAKPKKYVNFLLYNKYL
jgi:hypothetical protein